MFQSICWICM